MYNGCYATMSNSSTTASFRALSYNHFIACDTQLSSCAWSPGNSVDCSVANVFTNQCCVDTNGGPVALSDASNATNDYSSYQFMTADVDGRCWGTSASAAIRAGTARASRSPISGST